MILACLVSASAAGQEPQPRIGRVTCGSQAAAELWRVLSTATGWTLNQVQCDPTDAGQRAAQSKLVDWLATGGGPVGVAILDQAAAMRALAARPGLAIWKGELTSQPIAVVALRADGEAATVAPRAWRRDRKVVRLGYIRGSVRAAIEGLVGSEVDLPVTARELSGPSALAESLAGGAIDLAVLPADDHGYVDAEFHDALRGRPVTVWQNASAGTVRFTAHGGEPYLTLSAQPPRGAGYALLRVERRRTTGATVRRSTGEPVLLALFRRLGVATTAQAAEGSTFAFPAILTTNAEALDHDPIFRTAVSRAYIRIAFQAALAGAHPCTAAALEATYTAYVLNAYLADPTEVNYCNLWAHYTLAAGQAGRGSGAWLARSRRLTSGRAVRPEVACPKAYAPSPVGPSPAPKPACRPSDIREFRRFSGKARYAHAMDLIAAGLAEPAGRTERFAEARSCLMAVAAEDPLPECRDFYRGVWLSFYDPYLPLGLLQGLEPEGRR
ncbi:MAG: hypothetical protein AB1635_14370 [Acidobacteriota bacterium]